MTLETILAKALQNTLKELYSIDAETGTAVIQPTRKEFEGDFTIVVFPFVKAARKAPDKVAEEIGARLQEQITFINRFNVVKGFLNISVADSFWTGFMQEHLNDKAFGHCKPKDEAPVLIEYSSPNTNKPLHLGHVRNNLLGYSVSQILSACGHPVIQVNLVNDRGIHICKSMVAWLRYGNGETPETARIKGDHLVGKYYVLFDKHYKEEQQELREKGMTEDEAAQQAPIMLEARTMLQKWENGDEEVRRLWGMMNRWVYEGFDSTYGRLGIKFDKTYYESETYLLGKELVAEGLESNAFYRHPDGSVRVDLTGEGLDEKILLRKDGTSVYMTQDLGTARLRYEEFHPQKMIYVVGNEQNYHFDVLKMILAKKLGKAFGNSIHHLSYGMVELPDGKMKSREGTVVDADDLMDRMYQEAKAGTEALGKFNFNEEEASALYEMIGLGALKYFILKVDPAKNMLFNPAESIDFNGNTAPFIQYTHARIRSLLRKAEAEHIDIDTALPADTALGKEEKSIVKCLYQYPQTLLLAGDNYSPALIANYIYELSKLFNHFYQETPVMKETDESLRIFRLQLSRFTGDTLRNGMALLGIDVPEKM